MKNVMDINGHKATIVYDPEIEMFRGEFIELSGNADFYATDVESLKKEAKKSLDVYVDICKESNIDPFQKKFSGKFNLRVSEGLHRDIAVHAKVSGKSLNKWISDALEKAVELN